MTQGTFSDEQVLFKHLNHVRTGNPPLERHTNKINAQKQILVKRLHNARFLKTNFPRRLYKNTRILYSILDCTPCVNT